MEKVDVIILANNVNDYYYNLTKQTIDTLRGTDYDVEFNIIIIESNVDSEYVFKNCTIVKPNKKFNYAEFTNIGYSLCKNDWVMVCNNDLSFEKDWFKEIMKVYKTYPEIKSFSPFEPDFHTKYYNNYFNEIDDLYFGYEVPAILTGWCYLHRRDILDSIGGCDEQFEFYYVDNDYGKMLEYYGISHCLVKSSVVHHLTNASHETIPHLVSTDAGYFAKQKFDKKWDNISEKPFNFNKYQKTKKIMKICQVNPGILPIPPNGWGAVEKIIWEYKQEIEKAGHICDIKYLNEINKGDYDIVHVHMGNLAIELANRDIPYIFSLHDHHVVHFGKESGVYQHNLEAIKKSVISFTHAEYLVDYFDDTDKLFYISHGVNNEFFQPTEKYRKELKLLCIANNGIGGNSTHDRKGFRYAIEAARKLNLPITVAGPENNMNFFEANPDLMEYPKLTILKDNPNEDAVRNLYQTHTIFLHPSNLEAGHPNLTLLEAMSCGLPVVGTYSGSQELKGMYVTDRNSDNIAKGIQTVISGYRHYVDYSIETAENLSWKNIVEKLLKVFESVLLIPKEYDSNETKRLYIQSIESTLPNVIPFKKESVTPHIHFVNQPQLYLNGDYSKPLRVEFYDERGVCHYGAPSSCGMWVALNRRYYTKWRARVLDGYDLLWEEEFNANEKRVFVTFDSKSLGDTLAWIPQVERFRLKHKCEMIVSTFHNNLLKNQYPNIQFVNPGDVVENVYAMYSLGIFYNSDGSVDYNKHKNNPREISLIQVASDILGLDFVEHKPQLPIYGISKKRQVSIAIHSTAQAKYWNNPSGWQDVVDYIKLRGYDVVLLSREHDGYMGNLNPQGVIQHPDGPVEDVLQTIQESELFIGLSSGLSWLSWGTDTPTVIISGFTDDTLEPKLGIERIINKSVCHGCWSRHRFNPGDWNWCPDFKDTPRQFECTKSITSDMVIDVVKKYLK
jgi:autotransporter strand-loop-strand O-heptosyltransferase